MRVLLPRSISYFRFLSYTSRTDGLENQFWFRFDCGFATYSESEHHFRLQEVEIGRTHCRMKICGGHYFDEF